MMEMAWIYRVVSWVVVVFTVILHVGGQIDTLAAISGFVIATYFIGCAVLQVVLAIKDKEEK